MKDRLRACGDDGSAVALAVGARAALRAIPLLEYLEWDKPPRKRMRPSVGRQRMSKDDIVLGCFRSAATAWVAAMFPAFGASERFHGIKHAARLAGGAEHAGKSPANAVGAATHATMMATISLVDKFRIFIDGREAAPGEHCAIMASHAAAIAAHGFMRAYDRQAAEQLFANARDLDWIANRELSASERAVWDAARKDVQLWKDARDTQALLAQPLWLAGVPSYAQEDWRKLVARLRGRTDERWEVWIDWYEARLAGRRDVSEHDEIARVSLADDVWALGAAAVNASIAGQTVAQR